MASTSIYSQVRQRKRLRDAWSVIHENGCQSKSLETRRNIKAFAIDAEVRLEFIYRQLLRNRFTFSPAKGVLQERPGKSPRPIAISPISDRIVQRSILDVLTDLPAIQDFIDIRTSFGGLRGKGVRSALEAAMNAIQEGATFYIRSDISNFFMRIPRARVLAQIGERVRDPQLLLLLEQATECELSNMAQLGKGSRFFPSHEIGVAQGCCLSPLFGNVLLTEFDRTMNGRGIICLRYIDDFLVLGHKQSAVRSAFNSAQRMLNDLGMFAYSPGDSAGKSEEGNALKGLDFLGCSVSPGRISPNKKSRARLMESVDVVIDDCRRCWKKERGGPTDGTHRSLVESLADINNVLQGWGNQYAFCNDPQLFSSLDKEVDKKLASHLQAYKSVRESISESDAQARRRRLLGVHLLADSKQQPILPLKRLAPKVGLD